ncbi:L-rhamnose/proton symporter RhaT [Sediminibacterium soli]|uniref:L-rhamnose/proton symporter RhaT n=1 Tax=Sediminibacterium soli TaxID=2698829 RepID=UPI00137B3674|nr:L-rhamnose/proton symporter RhaT [Sediminibacterium soli]NCI48168.1 rhamnose:proton symporter [Sediminibacterium soli]
MEAINGILYHAVGASGAALCYTPGKGVKSWSWQTYWLLQAAVCWLALPVLVALITIPELRLVLQEAPTDIMQKVFLLGMAYGIGGTAFGIAIRYLGFSLTYAIAVGISCVLGTLLPPLVHGTLTEVMQSSGAGFLMGGVAMGAAGIALCGVAGRNKEKDMMAGEKDRGRFSLRKGLPLCLLAGILSALYGFALDHGQPIADVAAQHGAGNFQGNVIYIFANTGAFVSTACYCLYLHVKEKTFREFGNAGNDSLLQNYLLSALTGVLWYGQFFFYGLGHVRMGRYRFSSWAIHMIMLVLFSTVAGIIMKEWKQCSVKTKRWLALALLALVTAILLLTYGNYLGENK